MSVVWEAYVFYELGRRLPTPRRLTARAVRLDSERLLRLQSSDTGCHILFESVFVGWDEEGIVFQGITYSEEGTAYGQRILLRPKSSV